MSFGDAGVGLSALQAASEAIDTISNNIANAQTVGYKAGTAIFSDEFFRATDPANPNRTGMGTAITQVVRSQTNGTIVATSNPLDLAIGGLGMFTTATSLNTNGSPTAFQYTRNGQFGVDNQNRIVNSNGNYLVGFPANPDGTINKAASSVLTLDQSPLPGAQTRNSTININLDDSQPAIPSTPFSPLNSSTYTQSTSQVIYDTTGVSHTLNVYYQKDSSVPLTITPAVIPPIAGQSASFSYDANQAATGSQAQVATTASSGSQLLQNASVTQVAGSTYLMTLADKSTLTVTGVDASGNAATDIKNVANFQVNTSRYSVYATIDGSPVPGPALTTATASASAGVQSLTFSPANSAILLGQTVSGAGISAGTTVTGVVPATTAATTSSGSPTVTISPANLAIAIGQSVSGTGIPPRTTVSAVSTTGGVTTVTLSGNATSGGTPSLSFVGTGNYVSLSAVTTSALSNTTLSFSGGPFSGYPAGDANSYAINSVAQSALGTMAFVGGRNIDNLGGLAGGENSTINISATTAGATPNNLAFVINTTGNTAYAGSSQTLTNSQDGAPLSQLTSYSFDNTGTLKAVYSNGQSKTMGQVQLAYFNDDAGLIPIGGNSYEQSAISGSPIMGVAAQGVFGSLKAQSLEQSNVDLTGQLVLLMTMQRQYSAASQVVKTSQTIEDDVLNKLT
jgi:flagellar hook protein FlgE